MTPSHEDGKVTIQCDCGKAHAVSEGAAGTTLKCSCGCGVQVPRLAELRRLTGRTSTISPEMHLDHLQSTNQIDVGGHCALCGVTTERRITLEVECERAWVKGGGGFWSQLIGFIMLGWVGLLIARLGSSERRQLGADKIYQLPLPICEHCRPRLKDRSVAWDCLMQIPVYGDLLEKFPNAKIRVAQ